MNAHSDLDRTFDPAPEPSGPYIPLILVRSIYAPRRRDEIRGTMSANLAELGVGMHLFLAEVLTVVHANNKRIRKPDGAYGLHLDQLNV